MSKEAVQAIMGTAITDKEFLHELLHARREKALSRFELTSEERRTISSIKADTLEQFARQLDNWLVSREQELIIMAPKFRFEAMPSLSS